jgi:hypothetical protein
MIEDVRPSTNADDHGASSGGTLTAGCPVARRMVRRQERSVNFVILWIVVSGLWTLATVLRMRRTWLPWHGWPEVLNSGFAWASLFLPPMVFAVVLLGMSRVASPHLQRRR